MRLTIDISKDSDGPERYTSCITNGPCHFDANFPAENLKRELNNNTLISYFELFSLYFIMPILYFLFNNLALYKLHSSIHLTHLGLVLFSLQQY
jgi:hypothetical protein